MKNRFFLWGFFLRWPTLTMHVSLRKSLWVSQHPRKPEFPTGEKNGKKEIRVNTCLVTAWQVRHAVRYVEMLGKSDGMVCIS